MEPWGSMLPTQEERRSYRQEWLREAFTQLKPRAPPAVLPLPRNPWNLLPHTPWGQATHTTPYTVHHTENKEAIPALNYVWKVESIWQAQGGVGACVASSGHLSQWYREQAFRVLGKHKKIIFCWSQWSQFALFKPRGQIGHYTTCAGSHFVCSFHLFSVRSPLQMPLKVLGNNIS